MIRNRRFLFILLGLGIVLVGLGIWLLFSHARAKGTSSPEDNSTSLAPAKVTIRDYPIVYEKLEYAMRGQNSSLYIYDDGNILYIEEKGLRIPTPDEPATRTWYEGKIELPQLDSLLGYLERCGLDGLDSYYQFQGEPIEGGLPGSFRMGDMALTISINARGLQKTLTAFGYVSPDKDESYPDMPPPLNEVYVKLRALALATEQVHQENIPF